VTIADQLVFGYDEGHRLLAGSRTLTAPSLAQLLGATDAAPGSDNERLITGIPLKTEQLFALCFTWTAPEVDRPGAVWAHVLLVSNDDLGDMQDPMSLVALAKRPTTASVSEYDRIVEVAPARTFRSSPRSDVMRDLVAATYSPDRNRVVVISDLDAAETALGLIWRSQWPALRTRFAFRTRNVARSTSSSAHVVATRRIHGRKRSSLTNDPTWIKALTSNILAGTPKGLREFLWEFGPFDNPEPESVSALAAIFEAVQAVEEYKVEGLVEGRYPGPERGTELKVRLFGAGNDALWLVPEDDKLLSILAAREDAWDSDVLALVDRLLGLMARRGTRSICDALPSSPTTAIKSAVIEALAERGEAEDVASFARSHLDIAAELLVACPELGASQRAWLGVDTIQVKTLLQQGGPIPPSTVAAALEAGHQQAAIDTLGLEVVLAALANDGRVALAADVLRDHSLPDTIWGGRQNRIILLIAAARPDQASVQPVLTALEELREQPDELWLRAAVKALCAPRFDEGQVITVVFGPLHHAITANILPHDCWEDLDTVLPAAQDPALRLRRHLLSIARREGWSAERMVTAVRDAGPFGPEIRKDFAQQTKHEDDWWIDGMKTVFRSMGWPGR
jgi:hypothetical protein